MQVSFVERCVLDSLDGLSWKKLDFKAANAWRDFLSPVQKSAGET
jgi:hypothetical protein